MISGFQIGFDSCSHSREHQVTSWGKVTHSSMRDLVLSISLCLICSRCGISLSLPLCWVYMQSPSGFGLFCQVLLSLKFSLKYFRWIWVPPSKDRSWKDNMDFNNIFFLRDGCKPGWEIVFLSPKLSWIFGRERNESKCLSIILVFHCCTFPVTVRLSLSVWIRGHKLFLTRCTTKMGSDTDASFLAQINLACSAKIQEIAHPRHELLSDSIYGGSNTNLQISYLGLQYYELIWGGVKECLYPPPKLF